jgi:hypothetical protein
MTCLCGCFVLNDLRGFLMFSERANARFTEKLEVNK